MLLEPLRPFLVTADAEGVLRVSNYRAGGVVNRFHAALGVGGASSSSRSSGVPLGPPVSVRALYQVGGGRVERGGGLSGLGR